MSWIAAPHPDDPPRVAELDPTPVPQVDDRPVITRPYLAREPIVIPVRSMTRPAAVLIALPILVSLALNLVVALRVPLSVPVIVIAALIGAAVAVLAAERDQTELRSRGFDEPTRAVLAAIAPIVYLAVRAHRLRERDLFATQPVGLAVGAMLVGALLFCTASVFAQVIVTSTDMLRML